MNKAIADVLCRYPDLQRQRLAELMNCVTAVAQECELGEIDASLKWGEPSFTVKGGSSLRMDWKSSDPQHIALYFHCQSKLVATFRELYPQHFHYAGNRALLLPLERPWPIAQLKHCIELCLRYHKLKHLPLLGA